MVGEMNPPAPPTREIVYFRACMRRAGGTCTFNQFVVCCGFVKRSFVNLSFTVYCPKLLSRLRGLIYTWFTMCN